MRLTLGLAFCASCAAAQSGNAQISYVPDASAIARRLVVDNSGLLPGAAIKRDFRLRVEFVVAPSYGLLDDPNSNLQRRFASSMMDLYPVTGQGFHLSGGLRFYRRTNFVRDAEKLTQGLLYNPRMPGGGIGMKGGFKRFTPALTFGYNQVVHHNLILGIEAGTLLGRVNSSTPKTFRGGQMVDLDNRPSRLNPILNVVAGFRF